VQLKLWKGLAEESSTGMAALWPQTKKGPQGGLRFVRRKTYRCEGKGR